MPSFITRSPRALGLLAIAIVAVGLAAFACGGDVKIIGPFSATVHQCNIGHSANWPSSGNLYLDPPTECPLTVNGVGIDAQFAATAIFTDPSQVTPFFFQYTSVNFQGNPGNVFLTPTWTTGASTTTLEADGDYTAASGGWNSNNQGFDSLNLQILTTQSSWQSAGVYIPYTFGTPGLALTAPDSIGPGVSFSAHASVNDITITPPVTYQWSVNGVAVSGNGPDFSGYGPTDGNPMSLQVTFTDSKGVQYFGGQSISACSNNQIQC
jgi:hypothetical protein